MAIELLIPLVLILIISVVAHEVSHGYMAEMLGDPTARLEGRLTLNPLKHLDLWGSILIPLLLIVTKAGFLIGWAKPVPYNPYNLRDQRWGEAKVAIAGPLVNLCIALVFGLLIRFGAQGGLLSSVAPEVVHLLAFVVYINLLLAFFNLIPIPPLDGSKVLAAILPFHLAERYRALMEWALQYGFFVTIAFVFLFLYFLWPFFFAFLTMLFEIITDIPFEVFLG
ncbi:MAG: site-2 protease family protein [Parcubacteria group bacterium]|nr:site-2 protease family protein [Parcubacteria group bacterium]